ncbi:MAG: proton-conducting transporter membrane subunit [Candidatus Omnitrophota bacterium]|jgi:multicomponent Na+:H+ antiporter subunit D
MLSPLIAVPFFSILVFNLPFIKPLRKTIFAWSMALLLYQIVFSCLCLSPLFLAKAGIPLHIFNFNLSIDGLSVIMLFLTATVLLFALIVSSYFIQEERRRFNFINLTLFLLCALNGLVLVRDIFSLYIFVEITAITSYVLIAFDKDMKALSAVFKYVVLSTVASILMLSSIAIVLLVVGDTKFTVISQTLNASGNSPLIMLSVSLFLCGLFVKAGLVPFHGWLPEVYSYAGASVSILLGGIISKMLGVYTLIRVLKDAFVLNSQIGTILLVVGAASILIGAFGALAQKNFKKMLAYSSISQVGYIIIGLAALNPIGFFGAVFHFFNHSIFKSLLFVNSAALEKEVGSTDMGHMGGLSKNMPITATTSVLGMLSAAGIPPLAGFWSKLLIIIALFIGGHYVYAAIAVFASVLTLAYLLSMQRMVFFGKLNESLSRVKEAGFGIILSAIVLSAIIVLVGLLYPFVLNKLVLLLT